MHTTINDLKEMSQELERSLAAQKAENNVEAVAELAAMLARVEIAIEQYEAAHDLLDDAEELLEKYDGDE